MRDGNNKGKRTTEHGPSFRVQDEIRRDRHMRRTSSIRRARSATHAVLTTVLCLAICCLLITAVALTATRAKSVTVSGNARYTAEEILQAADIDGDVLFFLGEKNIYDRVAAVCPYVERIELVKGYPSSVEIVVYETEPVYFTTAHGRQFSLDRELRVMDYTEHIEGLVHLQLPELKSAVEGSRVVFVDPANEAITLELLATFLYGAEPLPITLLDLTDRYALAATLGDTAKVLFGDYQNLDVKITLAKKMIADAKAADSMRTLIDVSEPSRASAQYGYEGGF